MHLKRQEMQKEWPLSRKGNKYVKKTGKGTLPLIVVMRDMLKIARTKKEIKKIIHEKKVKINERIAKDEKTELRLFDIVSINDKNFVVVLKNKKFNLDAAKSMEKTAKIIGKRMVKDQKIQINLNDGRNYIIKEKVNVGDSAVIDLKENKIKEILPFKEKSRVLFISGKHISKIGRIENIGENVKVEVEGNKIEINKKNLMIIK